MEAALIVPRSLPSSVARLLENAVEFARSQSSLAGLFESSLDDPAVERVREGLFFLGGTIIDQVRRFEADGNRALADIVAPDLCRPFPAATIVQFGVADGDVARVPAGTELLAPGDPRVRFRLIGDLDVGQSRIDACRVEPEQRLSLRFDLVTAAHAPLARGVGASLRVFIDEPRETALGLLHHLLTHTRRVELRRTTGETVPIEGVVPFGFAPSHALVPEPDGVETGVSLVREYFLLPEKFFLFELTGIRESLGHLPDSGATVIFRFDAPLPQSIRVSPSALRAHCTPAVNLFPTTAEPKLCMPAAASFSLRVAGLSPEDASVYAVVGAWAKAPGELAQTVHVPPARRFGASQLSAAFPYFYVTKLEDRASHTEPDTVFLLTSPRKAAVVLEPHVISVDLLGTNRHVGARVRPGDLSGVGRGVSSRLSVRNIVPTSSYLPSPSAAALALRSLVRGQVARPDPLYTLKALLYALVPGHGIESEASAGLAARVDAVAALEVRTIESAGRTRRGYLARFTIDETPFAGIGDVALFVRVLHQLLDLGASLNGFFNCEVLCLKSGQRWQWPPAATPRNRGQSDSRVALQRSAGQP